MKDELQRVFKMKVSLAQLADSTCLFIFLSRASRPTERLRMIDLESTSEDHNKMKTDDILDSSFTKASTNDGLQALMKLAQYLNK